MDTLTLHITGMACGGCAAGIKAALLKLEGVTEAEVSHPAGTADVRYDASKVTPDQLRQAVITAGYQVS